MHNEKAPRLEWVVVAGEGGLGQLDFSSIKELSARRV